MSGPQIGFACLWDRADPRRTWSYTPWSLREAMRRYATVTDVGIELSAATEFTLKLVHLRLRGGRPTSTWRESELTDRITQRQLVRRVAASDCEAVLQIQDLVVLDRPYFLYQDFSFDAILALVDQQGRLPTGLTVAGMSREQLLRYRDRQRRIYDRATGLVVMSRWLAGQLTTLSGVPPEKVHVVNPGRSALATDRPLPPRERPRRRLLLVGKGFEGKGGDLVVDALAVLRREVDPEITLTVAGPATWPLPGEVPDGVRFLGSLPATEVARLYDTHDLLVMPSRLEGFGIVFVEALARGLPCVARNAFAMPELIEPGVNGDLISQDDPVELATTVAKVLDDDHVYEQCRARADAVAAHFTWDRAARQMVEVVTGATGGTRAG